MMFIGSPGRGGVNGGGRLPELRSSSYSTGITPSGACPSPRSTTVCTPGAEANCSATRSTSEPSTISTLAPEW